MEITDIREEIDRILKTGEKDYLRVLAFKEDFLHLLAVSPPEQHGELYNIPLLLGLKLAEGVRSFRWYNPRSWDITREFRKTAKDLAEKYNFSRYLLLI